MRKSLIILLLIFSFTIVDSVYNICYIETQEEFYKNNSYLSNNFININFNINIPELNITIKYPENWTLQNTSGNNKPTYISNENFKFFIEESEKFFKSNNMNLNDLYPTDFDKFQFFLEKINKMCSAIWDCRLIEDKYLRSYFIDLTNIQQFVNIFDYLPSVRFVSPIENLTDIFLDNVKIASFKLPHNLTINKFINFYYGYYDSIIPSFNITEYNCQSYILGYPGCKIEYIFNAGNNIEYRQYKNSDLFIEKNDKIFLFSYNALSETYLKYSVIVQAMLESLELH